MSRVRKTLLGAVLVLAVIALLFTVVFPWVDQMFVTNPVLGGP
jgi:MFS-type transporter involved in bile tolerance (Atg22 family)